MDYAKRLKEDRKELYDMLRPVFGNENREKTYKTEERPEKTDFPLLLRKNDERQKEIVREVIIKKRALPRFEDDSLMPLKKITPNIIGNIFDRVRFLEQRIDEIRKAMDLRGKLHAEIVKGIEEDIREKERMIIGISDMDEKRNLKLDISLLMKEQRRENIEFWRDTYTLHSELREILEDYQIEKKIAGIFSNLDEMNNGKAVMGE